MIKIPFDLFIHFLLKHTHTLQNTFQEDLNYPGSNSTFLIMTWDSTTLILFFICVKSPLEGSLLLLV